MKLLIIFLLLMPLAYALECEGCEYNGKCVKIGTQRLTSDYGDTIYCNTDRKIEIAKNDSEPCIFDYECKSFFCDNECKTLKQEKEFNFVYVLYGLIVILVVLILVAIISSFKHKKKTKRIEKKPIKVELKPIKKKYKTFDTLESNIQYSMEKLSELFRRK